MEETKKIDLQPTLNGKLITLRPLVEKDFDKLYESASDPLIWEQHPQFDRYKKEIFQLFFDGAMKSKGAFAIVQNSSGKIIGSSRYYDYDQELNQLAIGYTFLSRECWGGLFNAELKSLMMTHAFQFVDNLIFEVGESNRRSRKAVEKIGGHLAGSKNLDGKNHVVYKITKAEFQKDLK